MCLALGGLIEGRPGVEAVAVSAQGLQLDRTELVAPVRECPHEAADAVGWQLHQFVARAGEPAHTRR